MSNNENFSAEELLRRLKANMEVSEDEKENKTEEDAKEPEETAASTADEESSAEADKTACEEMESEPAAEEIACEEENGEDEKSETIAFEISAVQKKANGCGVTEEPEVSEPVEEEIPVETDEGSDDGEDFSASTIVIPEITELEAPDMEAFAAAQADEEAQKDAEMATTDLEPSEKSDDIDEKLIDIMIAMDREEELRAMVGDEKYYEIMEKYGINSERKKPEEKKPVGFAFDGEEFEETSQAADIGKKYNFEKSRASIRMIGTAILALCLLIFENMHLLGVMLPGAFNIADYPALHVFVSLQLLVFAAAISYKEMLAGFAAIPSMEFGTNTLAAITVAFTALCDLLIAFFGASADVRLYNFAAAFVLLLCAFHDYFGICREINGFKIVSSKKSKYAVVPEARMKGTEREFGFENFEEEELLLNIKKVDFVDSYFSTTNKKNESNRFTPYFIFGALAVSVVFAIISFVNTKDIGTAFAIANLTALMCLPITTFAVTSLPSFLASKSLVAKGAAIIGDAAADEYSGASTVIFDDKDVFPSNSVKIRSVKVYGDARIDTVLCDAASIYAKLGGPLHEVLKKAMEDTAVSEDVAFVEGDESGYTVTIDSERTILLGDATYMQQRDIFPPEDYEDEIQLASGNVKIMYMADGAELAAKMYVQYTISPAFDPILRKLHKNDIRIVIKTMDPNIDNTLLVGKAKPANYPAKIEKCPIEEAGKPSPSSVQSALVSVADVSSIVSAILLCDKLQHVKFTSGLIKIVSVIVSLAIMMIFILANSSALILSVFVAIYHLFWVLPVFAISKMYLN